MTWNPFKKTTDEQPAEQDEPAASKESGAKTTEGKGRPTPKRKEAQARNLRPLAPKDRQASAKAAMQVTPTRKHTKPAHAPEPSATRRWAFSACCRTIPAPANAADKIVIRFAHSNTPSDMDPYHALVTKMTGAV